MKIVACSVGLALSAAAMAVPLADRLAKVDAVGVMRWVDDGSEVALFGVNYYPPFSVDYKAIRQKGLDFSEVMREDVSHFRRLGLTCIRIHCFDTQFSTHDGALVENHHVSVLDELIALCASNGIYTVLTPIAWWGGTYAEDRSGFSNDYSMEEMTSNRSSWAIQARFLEEFGRHVNPFTGRRYADDPAILCFELINEPLYPPNHADAQVTDYVNALADGLRASGTKKPVFYNSWQGRNAAVGRARIDGVTGSSYPTGLKAGHALHENQLCKVRASSLHIDDSLDGKALMIYEFDCADTPGAYMYPAFAKMFRHEGVQVASQFQYDPLCLAEANTSWMTHYLNLVYTPAKALSFAIAAEAFRRMPRGCDYESDEHEIVFPPFRVDADRNLSQMATETDYLYSADPVDPPPAPSRLRRVWGVGASTVVASTGNGAYFLDRAAPGVWRLQLYPSVFRLRDEYSGGTQPKVVVLPECPSLAINLPGLGPAFRVRNAVDGVVVVQADKGRVTLAPGDYVVEDVCEFGARERAAVAALDTPPYRVRATSGRISGWRMDVPSQWRDRSPLPLEFAAIGVTNIVVTVQSAGGDEKRAFPVRLCSSPDEWEYLPPGGFSVDAKPGAFADEKKCEKRKFDVPTKDIATLFPFAGPADEVVVRARAKDKYTKSVELVLRQSDGRPWGTNIALTTEWRTIRIPVDSLRYFGAWKGAPPQTKGDRLDVRRLSLVHFSIGKWLCKDSVEQAHGFEVESLRILRAGNTEPSN